MFLPVRVCAEESLAYSLLDSLQVNLGIVWQDAAVHFDFPPPLYSSRYSFARRRVTWRFHGHEPRGFRQLYCMLPVSGLMQVCFSTNCLMWIAGAQGGNNGVGRPCSSLTTTPFCKRKAWSGSYHHFQCLLWKVRMNTDPKSCYLLLIFPTACTYLFFITFILTAFVLVCFVPTIWLL